jgi:Ricin-type beta-trefoil lectin domain/Putative Ig domain
MTMSGNSRVRLSRILITAVLGAGLAATCAAANPGSSAASRTAATTVIGSPAKPAARTVVAAATAASGVILINPGDQVAKVLPETVRLQMSARDSAGDALSYTATGLPPGVSINGATGLISGTVTAYFNGTVSVTATDTTDASATVSFNWLAENTISVTWTGGSIEAGTTVSVPVAATDSAAGQTFTFSATGLPPGLSIDPTSGVVTGTTTVDGQYPVTITATDGGGSHGSATGYWDVESKPSITSPGNLTTTAGQLAQISLKVGDTASNASLYYKIAGGPPGAYINWNAAVSDGWRTATLTGWAAPAGTYKTTITLLGDVDSTASVTFTWTVKPGSGTGPTGPVRLNEDGMCLDDTNNKSTNGNKVQLWPCNGEATQNWTYAEDGTLRIHGKCLDDTGYGTKAGTKLQLWSCTNHTNQMWTYVNTGSLESQLSGLCLSAPYGFRNGTQAELGGCGGTGGAWALPAGEIMSGVPGKCITDSGGATANSTKIVLEPCANSSAQRWTVEPDGTIRIFGKCLSLATATSASSAVLWSCGAGHMQQWSLFGGDALGSPISASGAISITGTTSPNGYTLQSPPSETGNGTQLVLGADGGPDANEYVSNADWHVW